MGQAHPHYSALGSHPPHLSFEQNVTRWSESHRDVQTLTKEQYCSLITKFSGSLCRTAFGNVYYAESFFALLGGTKEAGLPLKSLIEGHRILTAFDSEGEGEGRSQRAKLVFDWLDSDNDGVLSRKDVARGVEHTSVLLRRALGYQLSIATGHEIKEQYAIEAVTALQRSIPNVYGTRFMNDIFSTQTLLTREQWTTAVISEDDPTRQKAIVTLTESRCGAFLRNLHTVESILSLPAVSPILLSSEEALQLESEFFRRKDVLFGTSIFY